jgi:hypothetical protein
MRSLCALCYHAELRLKCRPESVAEGRHFVASTLLGWRVADGDPAWTVLGDVLLVTSELLGNAVQACTGEILVGLATHRDRIRVHVVDESPLPAVVRASSEDALSGRGLAIVAALSVRWGQSKHDGTTKDVWAEIAVGPGSVLADDCDG